MTDYYGPLVNVRGAHRDVVVDPRFGTGAEPTAPAGWDGGGGEPVGVYDPRFGTGDLPTQPSGWGGLGASDTPGEIWVDTDYTGTTDASAAINAAITTALAAEKPLTVRLAPGILRLNNPIGLKAGVRLIGSGMGHTILAPYGTSHGLARASGYVPDLDDMTLQDFQIDGSNQTLTGSSNPKGAFFTHARRITVRNLYIHDTNATGLGIDHITGIIENVWAIGNGRSITSGLYPGTPGCSGIGIGVGSLDAQWEPLTITGCHAEGNGNYGIFAEAQVTPTAAGFSIIGCTSRNNLRAGIGDCGSFGGRIIGNSVVGNPVGIELSGGTVAGARPGRHALVEGNYVADNTVGVKIDAPTNGKPMSGVMVAGNTIRTSTSHGVEISFGGSNNANVLIDSNQIYENAGDALHVAATTSSLARLAVTDNRAWSNTGAAVSINSSTSHARVTGNEAWSNGSGVFFSTARTHTSSVVDTAWVEGANTLP